MWINGFSGNATDSFSGHNGSEFSTVDNINDRAPKCCPCARAYGGGWWFHRYVWDFWLVDIAEQPIKRLEISKNVLQKGKNMISRVFFSYTKNDFFFTTAVSNPISMVNITKTLWTMTIIVALFGNYGAEIIPWSHQKWWYGQELFKAHEKINK